MTTATAEWNDVKYTDQSWQYQLQPGYELRLAAAGGRRRRTGPVAPVRFQRHLNKNLSCVDAAGLNWRIPPSMVLGWRPGKASDLTQLVEDRPASKFIPDPAGAADLVQGDPILLMLTATKAYIGFFERHGTSMIHYRDLTGKPYRIQADAFICKLPSERFRK